MIVRLGILTSILFFIFNGYAQKLELGNVTLEELKEPKHPIDTGAVAAIIFKTGTSRFKFSHDRQWSIETEVNCKIKIYKKEGLKYANQKVLFFVGGAESETLNFSDAATYNLVNGAIEKTKLKSDGTFKEDVNSAWRYKMIMLPSVQVGSIIEFSYKHVTPYITTFTDWRFQSEIPTNHVEYTAHIPYYFIYNTIITGYEKIDYKSEGFKKSRHGEIKHIYTGVNIPSIKDEDYISNIDDYTSILKFELASVNYPNQPVENVALDWNGVAKTIYDSAQFGLELEKRDYFEKDLQFILKNTATQDDKINAVLKFVKSKVKWNKNYGVNCSYGVKKAYQESKGNVADVNLILTAMLREAGFVANPILISTRSNGVSIFPSRAAFNYVICGVEIDSKIIMLDATDQNSLPNILPIRNLNWLGRMIRKDKTSTEIDLIPQTISSNSITVMATINSDDTVTGKIKEHYSNYNAFLYRDSYTDIAEDRYLENLEKKRNNIEISDYTVTGKKELQENIIEKYSFSHSSSVERIGDKLYFSPLLFFAMTENPFKQDKRKHPVDFTYPNQDKYIINITIPEGYAVESLPESTTIQMSGNRISFKYQIINTLDKIQFTLNFDHNETLFYASDYEELKAVFTEIVKKENEKVVLKKI